MAPDGRSYSGEWKNDQISGWGIYTWPNGEKLRRRISKGEGRTARAPIPGPMAKYTGEWKEGLQDGLGTLFSSGGETRSGRWVRGRYTGNV